MLELRETYINILSKFDSSNSASLLDIDVHTDIPQWKSLTLDIPAFPRKLASLASLYYKQNTSY